MVTLTAAEVHAWREPLLAMPVDDIFALDPALMQGRADVFPAAILLIDAVLGTACADGCRVSPRGLQHGLALRAAAS